MHALYHVSTNVMNSVTEPCTGTMTPGHIMLGPCKGTMLANDAFQFVN